MLRFSHQTLFCLGLSFALATPACVIHNNGGGDDGASEDGGGTDGDDSASSGSADGSGPGSSASSPGDSGPVDSGSGDSGPGDSGPGDDDTGAQGNQPTSGIWRYDGDVDEDTCNLGANGYDFGSYQLINNADGTFTVSSASEDPFDCNLDGDGSFHCPPRGGDAPDTMGANAHIEVSITVDGAFSSPTAGSGSQLGEMTCMGSDCGLAELYLGIQFPCHVVETFTTTHVR